MSDWRISRSGYSIVTGQGDERRVIASMPVNVPKEVIQPWLEAAMELVDLQASLQAENARLTSEVARLREELQKVCDFAPDYSESEAARAAVYASTDDCPDCKRCRERNWPPSNLCDTHYGRVQMTFRDRQHVEDVQHWALRDIAREALAKP